MYEYITSLEKGLVGNRDKFKSYNSTESLYVWPCDPQDTMITKQVTLHTEDVITED